MDAAHVLANGVDALERVLADLAGVRPSVGAITSGMVSDGSRSGKRNMSRVKTGDGNSLYGQEVLPRAIFGRVELAAPVRTAAPGSIGQESVSNRLRPI